MKYSEFMTALVEIYGPYRSQILEQLTARYIKNRFCEAELDKVLMRLTLSKSAKFKTPPDPAEFEEIFSKKDTDLEAEGQKWWEELNKKANSWRDCIISDIRAQAAVESMGGWIRFCTRITRDESGRDIDTWNRKQFIDLFKLYSRTPPEKEMKVLHGYSDSRNKAVLIGDSRKCRELVSDNIQKGMQIVENMIINMNINQGGIK